MICKVSTLTSVTVRKNDGHQLEHVTDKKNSTVILRKITWKAVFLAL